MIIRNLFLISFATAAAAAAGMTQAASPSPSTPHPFVVEISVEPAAKARLERLKEQIIVRAIYSGEPTRAKAKFANEIGEIDLGSEAIELPSGGGTASFSGSVGNDKWTWVKEPQVLINISSAFHAVKENILDCGTAPFQDSFKVAQSKPIRKSCKLLK